MALVASNISVPHNISSISHSTVDLSQSLVIRSNELERKKYSCCFTENERDQLLEIFCMLNISLIRANIILNITEKYYSDVIESGQYIEHPLQWLEDQYNNITNKNIYRGNSIKYNDFMIRYYPNDYGKLYTRNNKLRSLLDNFREINIKSSFKFTGKEYKTLLIVFSKFNINDNEASMIIKLTEIYYSQVINLYDCAAPPIQWLLDQNNYTKDYQNRNSYFDNLRDDKFKQIIFISKPSTGYNMFMCDYYPDNFGNLYASLCKNIPAPEKYYELYLNPIGKS